MTCFGVEYTKVEETQREVFPLGAAPIQDELIWRLRGLAGIPSALLSNLFQSLLSCLLESLRSGPPFTESHGIGRLRNLASCAKQEIEQSHLMSSVVGLNGSGSLHRRPKIDHHGGCRRDHTHRYWLGCPNVLGSEGMTLLSSSPTQKEIGACTPSIFTRVVGRSSVTGDPFGFCAVEPKWFVP